ncbi:unnamed protein product [Brassica rapa subsp. narinosa]|uniref:(rape) hypothetical protein n=1 Tax=Brassica napus TaxID=3708 RepID=A0A817AXA1_BRANA|nr:unnamed protein product [Brassica napus]CAF2291045.1 unnamed protein product [Brassica napus]
MCWYLLNSPNVKTGTYEQARYKDCFLRLTSTKRKDQGFLSHRIETRHTSTTVLETKLPTALHEI